MWMPLPCYSSETQPVPKATWQFMSRTKTQANKDRFFPPSLWSVLHFRLILWDTFECLKELDSHYSNTHPLRCVGGPSYVLCAMSIESSVTDDNEWRSEKQCPVSKNQTNMPFSRSQRSGPLSRRTPAIDSQLTKYAPLLEKANSVYNSEPTAFLKSATPTPPPFNSVNDGIRLH